MSDRRPTAVVLDAQPLSSVAADSGIASYVRNLVVGLSDFDDLELSALCAPDVVLPAAVRRIPMRRLSGHSRIEVVEHALRLPLEMRLRRPAGSVFHNPSFHAPAGVRGPWVQTLLDVIPLVFDSPDLAVLRRRWRRFGPRYRKADAVIAISQHAADEGVRLLGLDPGRVHVALLGVDPQFCVGDGGGDPVGGDGGGGGGGGGPYLLVVSEFSRRKGFAEAFAVVDALADTGYPHRLVVAGRIHGWAKEALAALHASARHPERIEVRGYVDDLVALYRGATVFVMASRYEGFGLPALEAMACGVPVVAFDNSSVTEVVGGGGQLVPDGDVVAMTAAVRGLLDAPALASEWRERGLAHARGFTWARTAAVHAEVYRTVAERAA